MKKTRDIFPSLIIDEDLVALVVREEEIVDFPYGDKAGRKMIVIPRKSYDEWKKSFT